MIDIAHLRKEYNETIALQDLSLQIPEGEVFGLIGPNGAGKTTLIRILATLLEPTFGHVHIDGVNILSDPLSAHPIIGYMSDFFSLYEDLLVWEYLDHFARCYKVKPHDRNSLIEEVLDLVSLKVRRDAEIKSLSRGMKQRLCFAKTLIHQPKVLLLDEPASGMDPAGRLEFRELLKKLREMGRTIVISSHILTEMTDFCSSIGIMEKGQLIESGRVGAILNKLQSGIRLDIELANQVEPLLGLLNEFENISNITHNGMKLSCRFGGDRHSLPALHRQIVEQGIPVVSFAVTEDNLEDIYMRISQHQTS